MEKGVDGCPCRIDFSRADSRLIASSGSETSISLRLGTTCCASVAMGNPFGQGAVRMHRFIRGGLEMG